MNKRVISIDLLKALGIFLVIWGHSIAFLSSRSFNTNHCFLMIYSFHMPLFMMVSGFFYARKLSLQSFTELLKDKSIRLLLPAILWGVVIAGLGFLNHLYKGVSDLHLKVVNSLFLSLWFLKCLFLCYILARFTNNIFGYIFTLCLSQFLPIWKLEIMYPCFIAGILLKHYYREIGQYSLTAMILFLISFSFLYKYLWEADMLKTHYLFIEHNSVFETLYVRIVRIIIGIAGSSFLILLFDKLFNRNNNHEEIRGLNCISVIGKETLGIYILQDIIVVGLISKIPGIKIFDEYLFSVVIAPLFSLIVLWICYKIVGMIKRNEKAAYYLLGVQDRKHM